MGHLEDTHSRDVITFNTAMALCASGPPALAAEPWSCAQVDGRDALSVGRMGLLLVASCSFLLLIVKPGATFVASLLLTSSDALVMYVRSDTLVSGRTLLDFSKA